MRIGALGTKLGALFNAEAMLFVNHGKLQILELNRPFDDRMSPDHDLDRAIGKTRANRILLRPRRIAN